MSQSGFTPVLIYASGTTGNSPSAANLTSSAQGAELALNYFDGKLFYKDASGNVQVLATKGTGPIGGSNTQIQYNSSGALAGSANLTFDGTNLAIGGSPVSSKGQLQVGTIGYTDTGVLAGFASSVAGYNQIILQNTNSGSTASTNFNVSNDQASATTNYGEFGINSSGFSGSGFSTAGWTYLASASTDLAIGTYGSNAIHFIVNSGTTDAMTISSAGAVSLPGGTANGVAYLNGSKVLTTGSALTFDGTTLTATAISDSGNLTFTGTGNRITGDFSNATVANRALFQTSTANSTSVIGVIPSGTGVISRFAIFNNSDPTNASQGDISVSSTEVSFRSLLTGTGTYLPMTFYTGGSGRMQVDTSGNLGVGTTSTSGYRVAVVGSTASSVPLYLNSDATNAYVYSSNPLYIGSTGAYQISFVTNNSERMRIDSSGNVGIGTSSFVFSAAGRGDLEINGSTDSVIGLKSNGTSTGYLQATSSIFNVVAASVPMQIQSTGANYIASFTNGVERMRIDSSGNLLVGGTTSPGSGSGSVLVESATGGVGYGTGAGGTVTQATSRTTGVTLNKPTGAITLFTAAGSITATTFTVTNSVVAATDVVNVCQKSGTNVYITAVTAVAAGSFNITFYTTGGVTSDAPVFNFTVIKGSTS